MILITAFLPFLAHICTSGITAPETGCSGAVLLFYAGLSFCHLLERGEAVIVSRYVRIVYRAVVPGHIESAVSEDFLQSERIASAVEQIFFCEGVPEQMGAGLFYAVIDIVAPNCITQYSRRHLLTEFVRKQIVIGLASSISEIFAEDVAHFGTERNGLALAVFGVP